MNSIKYLAEQLDGRPEDEESARMWSVVNAETGEVVASWRETPIGGMTEQDAVELADAWNAGAAERLVGCSA